MQNIQDAVRHFGQGARILEANIGRIAEFWAQMERAHLAQRSAEERWRQMEERFTATMEERWRVFEERLEAVVMDRVEAIVQQRLEEVIEQAVENKVRERIEQIDMKLLVAGGSKESNEATGETETDEECTNEEEQIQSRLAVLEASVQKALDVMFPRVETLLAQLEAHALLVQQANSPKRCKNSPACTSPLSPQTLASGTECCSGTTLQWPTASQIVFSNENLIRAAKEGKTDEVKQQLDAGISVNACDSCGNSALYWTACKGHSRTLSLLIERGADVNWRNVEGWTPLHAAARWGLTSCISLLLDAGASIDSRSESGLTPLHVAANSGREQPVRTLLIEGARITAKDNEGRTPIDLAGSSSVCRLLQSS